MNKPSKNIKGKNLLILLLLIFGFPVFIIIFGLWVGILNVIFDELDDFFDDENRYGEITYTIPEDFEDDGYEFYSYSGDDMRCNVSISESDKWDPYDYWFREQIRFNLNDVVGEVNYTTINDRDILHVQKVSDEWKYDYYGFESSEHYYLLEYSLYDVNHGDSTDGNICYTALDKILSSVKIK